MLRNCRKRERKVSVGTNDLMSGSYTKEVTWFVIHQVVSTLGVMILSAISCYQFVELLGILRINVTRQAVTSVLLGVPGFPFQGAIGLAFGFALLATYRLSQSFLYGFFRFFSFGSAF